MIIIMLGAPGSGKGTIGKKLCDEYSLEHVATGDIFRDEIKRGTECGIKANEFISQGKLVPDEITIEMVLNKLKKSKKYINKYGKDKFDIFEEMLAAKFIKTLLFTPIIVILIKFKIYPKSWNED